jgi:CheY-like chemotaxis protein
MADPDTYIVACSSCQASFDALKAAWCTCLASERSVTCPGCGACFCKGAAAYRQQFWRDAPKAMWERKFEEHSIRSGPIENPPVEDVKRPLVLLVDDEPSIQRVASLAIVGLGYGLVVGQNGEEGLDIAKRYKPDLVLTDALMPRMDGREMCRRIKEDPETASAKVVVMTSLYTNMKYHHEAHKSYRVDDFLNKPLDFDQLKSLLQKYLGSD